MRGNRLGLLMAIFLGSFLAAVVITSTSPAAESKPAAESIQAAPNEYHWSGLPDWLAQRRL